MISPRPSPGRAKTPQAIGRGGLASRRTGFVWIVPSASRAGSGAIFLMETVYPDDLRHAVGYDLASRAVADTQSSSQGLVTKKLWYDGLDRLVSEDYGSGARENASYVWDGSVSDKGRLSQVVRGTGVTASYGYDAVGRRTSRAVTYQGLSLGQGWSYDLAGSPVQWTLPGGAHGSAGYDGFHLH